VQLAEKQKAKYTYGILERQFSNLFEKASRMKGITGENLLVLCELRLDNVVYRLGIAPSRTSGSSIGFSQAHVTVNGNVVNIPSYTLRAGDVVSVREKSKSLETISSSVASTRSNHDWLAWSPSDLTGTVVNVPNREMIPENIKEQLIVELYSK
jgi:small subunit ribosomal protein S4